MPRGQNQGYPGAGDRAPASRLHAALTGPGGEAPVRFSNADASDAERLLRIEGTTLHIASFRIDRWGQRYVSYGEIRIDLGSLASEGSAALV